MQKHLFMALSGVAILVIILSPLLMWRYIWLNSCEENMSFHVVDKENVVQNQSSKYLIFTDEETLQNEDEIMVGKFNSSDFYRKIEIGKTYTARVCGWRIPPLSQYKNIIELKGEIVPKVFN